MKQWIARVLEEERQRVRVCERERERRVRQRADSRQQRNHLYER